MRIAPQEVVTYPVAEGETFEPGDMVAINGEGKTYNLSKRAMSDDLYSLWMGGGRGGSRMKDANKTIERIRTKLEVLNEYLDGEDLVDATMRVIVDELREDEPGNDNQWLMPCHVCGGREAIHHTAGDANNIGVNECKECGNLAVFRMVRR